MKHWHLWATNQAVQFHQYQGCLLQEPIKLMRIKVRWQRWCGRCCFAVTSGNDQDCLPASFVTALKHLWKGAQLPESCAVYSLVMKSTVCLHHALDGGVGRITMSTAMSTAKCPAPFLSGLPIIASGFLKSMNKQTCWSLPPGGLKKDLLAPSPPQQLLGEAEWKGAACRHAGPLHALPFTAARLARCPASKGQRFSSCRHKVWGGSGVIPKEASGGCKRGGKDLVPHSSPGWNEEINWAITELAALCGLWLWWLQDKKCEPRP